MELNNTNEILSQVEKIQGELLKLKQIASNSIKELKKLEYEKGKWYYFSFGECSGIIKYSHLEKYPGFNTIYGTEFYWLDGDILEIDNTDFSNNDWERSLSLATKYQIETILKKVAELKGFKLGATYKSTCRIYTLAHFYKLKYDVDKDRLVHSVKDGTVGVCSIYSNGKWAEIIKHDKDVIINGYKAEVTYSSIDSSIRVIRFGHAKFNDFKELTLGDLEAILKVMKLNTKFKGIFKISSEGINCDEKNYFLSKTDVEKLIKKLK
jgi:hypothetical protein